MPVGTAVVNKLAADLDELIAVDPCVFADGEALVDLHRQLERMLAVTTRATAAFDASGAWKPDGARSAATWLAFRCRLPVPSAQRRVRLGRDLRHLAATEAAWLCGFADGVFDPIAGNVIATELGRIDDPFFDSDWAEAKARVGEGVGVGDLARTPAQRPA